MTAAATPAFADPHWAEGLAAGLRALKLHVPLPPGVPLASLPARKLVTLLQDVINGYQAPHHLSQAEEDLPRNGLVALEDGVDYLTLRLNALSARAGGVSLNRAGVLYDDPLVALAAAATTAARGKCLALPLAADYAALRADRRRLLHMLEAADWTGLEGMFEPAVSNLELGPAYGFDLVTLPGAALSVLRERGVAAVPVDGQLRYAELFRS